jgi:hypothetical protein
MIELKKDILESDIINCIVPLEVIFSNSYYEYSYNNSILVHFSFKGKKCFTNFPEYMNYDYDLDNDCVYIAKKKNKIYYKTTYYSFHAPIRILKKYCDTKEGVNKEIHTKYNEKYNKRFKIQKEYKQINKAQKSERKFNKRY